MATDLGVTCIVPDFFRGLVRPDPRPNWEDKYSEYKNQLNMAQHFPLDRKWLAKSTCTIHAKWRREIPWSCWILLWKLHHHACCCKWGRLFQRRNFYPPFSFRFYYCLINGNITLYIPGNMANNNETEDDIYSSITSPQLIIPTPNDDKNVQPGGLGSQTLQNVGIYLGNTFYKIISAGNNLACKLQPWLFHPRRSEWSRGTNLCWHCHGGIYYFSGRERFANSEWGTSFLYQVLEYFYDLLFLICVN